VPFWLFSDLMQTGRSLHSCNHLCSGNAQRNGELKGALARGPRTQPVDYEAAGKYEQIVRTLMLETANADHRPEWKQGSFFRRFTLNP
jgi:hypothetical protein